MVPKVMSTMRVVVKQIAVVYLLYSVVVVVVFIPLQPADSSVCEYVNSSKGASILPCIVGHEILDIQPGSPHTNSLQAI